MLELLSVFEAGPAACLDLKPNHLLLLQRYSRELELLWKTYQKQRDNPPAGRNLPPVQMFPSALQLLVCLLFSSWVTWVGL